MAAVSFTETPGALLQVTQGGELFIEKSKHSAHHVYKIIFLTEGVKLFLLRCDYTLPTFWEYKRNIKAKVPLCLITTPGSGGTAPCCLNFGQLHAQAALSPREESLKPI
jgi:hypothetical protein